MIARSLRWRLLGGAAGAIFAALVVAWVAMGFLFEAHVERSVEAGLIQHGRDLVSGLSSDPSAGLVVDPAPFDPRFERPSSGLYWQVSVQGTVLRSRSLWDEVIAPNEPVSADRWTTGDVAGPFGQKLVFVARQVTLASGGAPVLVMLGADHAAVTAARAKFNRDLALFLVLLWAVLSSAAWVQVTLGLRPLDDVRAALADMQAQPSARLEEGDYPTEAAPLAQSINALADARHRDLEFAKRRAADLAHALKTPLAAIAAQSRRAREAGAGESADGIDRAVEAARSAVERELTRARLAAEQEGVRVEAASVVERLIGVVARTEAGTMLNFECDLRAASVPVSEAALMEIVGPLLENAAKFAQTLVRVTGVRDLLWIEDDGPGLTEQQMTQALERGRRLDEGEPGYGLGLAIATEAIQLSGGALCLNRSSLGGLCVELAWSAPGKDAR